MLGRRKSQGERNGYSVSTSGGAFGKGSLLMSLLSGPSLAGGTARLCLDRSE